MIEHVEEMLEMQFKCSKMGDVKYYLGMHVERDLDKGVLRLHQRKYCEGLAEKYGLQDGGNPATPLPSGFIVEPCADEEVVGESDRKLFHSMVGALNYAANHTRPDIAFATSRLASVVSRPSHEQLEAAKRLVRYVSATASVGLEYSAVRQRLQRGAADLTCYTDASFNSVKADGTSIGGYVCLFGGGAVSWRSKKQNEVGLSSCETEYMALHHGVKEVVWLRRLLEKIGVCQREPTVIIVVDDFEIFQPLIFIDSVSASGPIAPPCSCCLLSHQTLQWHHHLGHPSLPCLRGMHSRLLVSGLPRSLPPLPPSPAPPCLPCIEERKRAAPHSSSFPPATAPLQTLLMDMWGLARSVSCSASGSARIFLSCVCTLTEVQNGIAEPRIRLVMEVARTSMIHAAAPHFLWPFALRYTAHQLNLWPRVSLPETSPTLRWIGGVGDALVFRVSGSRAFVCDASTDKLSACAIPCIFLGLPLDAPGWHFTTPPRAVSSPLMTSLVASSAARGAASGVAASRGAEPGGAESEGAGSGGAEPGGAEPGGAEPGGVEPEGVEPGGAGSEGAECWCNPTVCIRLVVRVRACVCAWNGPAGTSPRLSPRPEPLSLQQLREWFAQRTHLGSGSAGSGDSAAGDAGAGGAGVSARAGGTGGFAAAGPKGARTMGTGAAGTSGVGGARAGDPTEPGAARVGGAGAVGAGAGGTGAGCAGAGHAGAGGARGTVCPGPYFVPLLQQPASPLRDPSPYTEQTGGLTERCEPASRFASPIRTGCCVPRSRPPSIPGTHAMALRPSSVPLHVPLPPPPESSLPAVPKSHRARATSPTVSRLLATAITDPSFESAAASSLVAELLNFAATYHLDYASALVAESESASPPSVRGECALGTDVLEDRQEEFECLASAVPRFASMLLAPEADPDAPDILTPRTYAEAITGPDSSQWQASMGAEMASWKSTDTYVNADPPSQANIVDGMWIFKVKRPPGSPPTFKARYIARGFSQRQGVNYFQTFSPTPKMTTLWVLLHVAAQCDYELHSLDFSTAFLQGSLREEIWLRRSPGFTGSFPAGTQWSPGGQSTVSARRLVLQRFGFQFSSPQPTPLSTDHSLSAPPSDESVEPSGPYPELVGYLMYLMTCTRPDLAYPLRLLARYVAPGRHRKVHWNAAKRVLRYLCSTSCMGLVLGGRGPAVLTGHVDAFWVDDSATQRSSQGYTFSSVPHRIYAGAMAAQELRWLIYLLTDLGEQPRLPPQLGHLHLAYVATTANIADIFTKALPSAWFASLDWSCDHLFSPSLRMGVC
ncbi:unnamed protein product [Closterium sp. NIES-53]